MRIARIERNKFNQAVSDGLYPCAPETKPGSRRLFEVPDLIGLHFFARMTERGELPRIAGSIVCRIIDEVRQKPDAERVYLAMAMNGANYSSSGDNSVNIAVGNVFAGDVPLEEVRAFQVANVRKLVLAGLADEAGVVGEDD